MTNVAPSESPRRPFPEVPEHERPFWTAGARGELVVQQCGECQRLNHPPAFRCRYDRSDALEWTVVSGRARVEGWSVNEHQWLPGFPAPYVIALVALDEDPGARLLTNLVGVEVAEIRAGMEVQARFERVAEPDGDDEVWLALFEPADANRSSHE
jgi:uncharacterized OB-fold protein